MSGNRSFGSNYHPSSQSRKISIGVGVDSSAKVTGKNVKRVLPQLQSSQNAVSVNNIATENGQKEKEVVTPNLGRQNNALHQENSPWVCTKKFYQKTAHSDLIDYPKHVSNRSSTSNVFLQSSGRRTVVETQSFQFFANRMVNLHAGVSNEKNFKKQTHQREGRFDGTMGREEESAHATALKVLVPETGIADKGTSEKGNSGNETLKLKLQELLGTVSSPNKQQNSSETLKVNADNLMEKSKPAEKDNPVDMNGQHLDTIESDSGSMHNTIRRPLTRSVTRKKPQAQKSVAKKRDASSCLHKQACVEENQFSFVEAWSKRLGASVISASAKYKRKESDIRSPGTEPLKKCFPKGGNKDETKQDADRRTTKAADKYISLLENRTGGLFNFHPKDGEMVEPNNRTEEKAPDHVKVMMNRDQPLKKSRDQPGEKCGSMLHNDVDHHDPLPKLPVMDDVDPQYDLKSPTFELKTSVKRSSSRSLFQTNQEDLDDDSLTERAFNINETHSFQSSGTPKRGHYDANTKNLAVDLEDSPVVNSFTLRTEGDKENIRSRSLSEESESSKEGSPAPDSVPITRENLNENIWSRSPCEEVDSEVSDDGSPIEGDGDNDNFHNASEQDGLAGAVTLFALALERVQRKIHSTTSRQAAEILLSVSKNIHWQLQDAESQIQTELGKLTSSGKSKRKRLENKCQEQQEQLKHIYEKFKEEVDQHLQNCQSTLEGLEAHRAEVRGTVEKQRSSHRKHLLQVEKTIETQLNDAQRRLEDVHKQARDKMRELKFGICACLKEGMLG